MGAMAREQLKPPESENASANTGISSCVNMAEGIHGAVLHPFKLRAWCLTRSPVLMRLEAR